MLNMFEVKVLLGKVRQAFKVLRGEGFLAKCNFSCCQSCAGYELSTKAGELVGKKKTVLGCVFWTHQDNADRRKGNSFYLSFGPLHFDGNQIGIDAVPCGERVIAALKSVGVKAEWNGTENQRIRVLGYN